MENYRDTYINRDIASLFPRLNKITYRRFLTILSKLSGTIINKRDLGRALEVNEGTAKEYLSIAEGTFLWRSLSSFERNIIKSIIKMPKGYMRDTGLLHYLTRINSLEDLIEDPLVGNSFESFVIEEILKGLEATFVTNWSPHYYRTKNGAEIDLLLDGPFGLLPIEIKYGASVKSKQLTTLSQFIDEHNLPFGMVINQSSSVEWLSPTIVQIPVGWI
jgi:predicted AAA+ superfamily ATPase